MCVCVCLGPTSSVSLRSNIPYVSDMSTLAAWRTQVGSFWLFSVTAVYVRACVCLSVRECSRRSHLPGGVFICDATRAFLDPFPLAFFAPATQPNTAAAASYVIRSLEVSLPGWGTWPTRKQGSWEEEMSSTDNLWSRLVSCIVSVFINTRISIAANSTKCIHMYFLFHILLHLYFVSFIIKAG